MTTASLMPTETATETWESETGQDYQLRDAVMDGLRHSGYRSLSNIKCEVLDGIVAIFGVVPSFFMKQVAQTIILRMGQVAIKNNLKVQDTCYEMES